MERIAEELKNLQEKQQLRHIPNIDSKSDGKIVVDGVEYVNFASNDYLGISTKSQLRKEFLKLYDLPLSSASARLLTGSSPEYEELEKTVSNIVEVQSRGAEVISVVSESDKDKMNTSYENTFVVPDSHPFLKPNLSVIPLQLFAYYVALNRGCDIDKPRNLAKSVTVE